MNQECEHEKGHGRKEVVKMFYKPLIIDNKYKSTFN